MSIYGFTSDWQPDMRMRQLLERLGNLIKAPDLDLINSFYDETLQLQSLSSQDSCSISCKQRTRHPRDIVMECIDVFITDRDRFEDIARAFTAKHKCNTK